MPALAEYDGMMWYRARVTLTKAQAEQAAKLALGAVDDVDVDVAQRPRDGQRLRREASTRTRCRRNYSRPARTRSSSTCSTCGAAAACTGPASGRAAAIGRRHDASRSTAGNTRCRRRTCGAPRAPWEPIAGINILYNGMIAPLGKFGLRGVHGTRARRTPGSTMRAVTRRSCRACSPTGAGSSMRRCRSSSCSSRTSAQLATTPVDSGWAQLRDAQRRAVAADGNAGLAVTIDIGNRDDIHPHEQAGRGQAHGARRAARGLRREDFGLGRAAEVGEARRGGVA